MDLRKIFLIQSTFSDILPVADQFAGLFYRRLFELDPFLRPMFRGSLRTQGWKLVSTLGVIVRGLQKPETILPKVREIGVAHVGYGVRPEHYDTVGAALLWALKQCLREDFTSEVELAWIEAYTLIAIEMQSSTEEVNTLELEVGLISI